MRYSDWLVTCPLLAVEIGLLLGLVPLRTAARPRASSAPPCSAPRWPWASRHAIAIPRRACSLGLGCLFLAGVGASLLCFRRDEQDPGREDRRLAGSSTSYFGSHMDSSFGFDATQRATRCTTCIFGKVTHKHVMQSGIVGV